MGKGAGDWLPVPSLWGWGVQETVLEDAGWEEGGGWQWRAELPQLCLATQAGAGSPPLRLEPTVFTSIRMALQNMGGMGR